MIAKKHFAYTYTHIYIYMYTRVHRNLRRVFLYMNKYLRMYIGTRAARGERAGSLDTSAMLIHIHI